MKGPFNSLFPLILTPFLLSVVAPNHAFLSSAYISDELTAAIHCILAVATDGVMLNSFLRIYRVFLTCLKTG